MTKVSRTQTSVHGVPALSWALHKTARMKPATIRRMILLCLVLPSFLTSSYGQEIKDISVRLAAAVTKSGKKTVAVVDFTDLQGCVTEFGRFLAEEFSVALATGSGGFEVIDRTNLKTLLQEHKLAATGIIDPQTARKVGEIAGVQSLVTGTVTPFGDTVHLSVKVLDAETAKIIGAVAADMPRNKAIDELLKRGISGGCNSTSDGTGAATSVAKSTDQPASSQPSGSGHAQIGEFLFSIESCRLSSASSSQLRSKVECHGTVTNQGQRRAEVAVNDRETNIVDNLGNQSISGYIYNMSKSIVRIGTAHTMGPGGTVHQELEPALPLAFDISGVGLDEGASTVSIIIHTDAGQAVIRNIRLGNN